MLVLSANTVAVTRCPDDRKWQSSLAQAHAINTEVDPDVGAENGSHEPSRLQQIGAQTDATTHLTCSEAGCAARQELEGELATADLQHQFSTTVLFATLCIADTWRGKVHCLNATTMWHNST